MRSTHLGIALAIATASMLATVPAWSQKAKPKAASSAKPAAPKAGKYGALAVDRSQGFVFAWAYDHPSRQAASEFALEECRKRDGECSVVVEFSGEGCASYHTVSESDGSAYGWGTAPTQTAADARSLQECTAFADGKASCNNHAWACNSADVAPFKVLREDPVRPKPLPTDCLVQFEVNIETDDGDDWVGRVHSPVYRLAAKDCPSTAATEYHSFYYAVHDGRISQDETNPEKKANPAGKARGLQMAKQHYDWVAQLQSPFSDVHFRPIGDVTVTQPTSENLTSVTDDVGLADVHVSDRWADASRVSGLCVAYRPPGFAPIAVYGAERCSRWIK